jgi:hypothetical protein
VAATHEPKLLQEFLAVLNRDLVRRVESGAAGDVAWAVKLCVGLTEASPDAMVAALGALVNDGTLWFHDPVIAVAFEAASQAPRCWICSPTSPTRRATCCSSGSARWRRW